MKMEQWEQKDFRETILNSLFMKRIRDTDIIVFIADFRKHFGKKFFLHGGCYIFARILQVKFWWTIYSNQDHCVLNKSWLFFDITGNIPQNFWRPYSVIDPLEELRYKNYQNWNW